MDEPNRRHFCRSFVESFLDEWRDTYGQPTAGLHPAEQRVRVAEDRVIGLETLQDEITRALHEARASETIAFQHLPAAVIQTVGAA